MQQHQLNGMDISLTGFNIQQGVRQGGILSADLYQIYVDPLLHRLQHIGKGLKIGHINCLDTIT